MKSTNRIVVLIATSAALLLLSVRPSLGAVNVAIVQGNFYTPNLKNDLVAAGVNVTEITSYTAASLTAFNAVIQYGNDFIDTTALTTYVTGGGTLVETPWFWNNNTPPPALQVVTNGGGIVFSQSYPGVTVLDPSNPLLNGVAIPAGTGGFNIGRTTSNTFIAGTTAIAKWNDGTAFIGTKSLGLGKVVAINMHVITSDTAFEVIDQPWATQLFVNAVGANQAGAVPEPSTLLIFGAGSVGLLFGVGRRRKISR